MMHALLQTIFSCLARVSFWKTFLENLEIRRHRIQPGSIPAKAAQLREGNELGGILPRCVDYCDTVCMTLCILPLILQSRNARFALMHLRKCQTG
jgi:hypothetical protein